MSNARRHRSLGEMVRALAPLGVRYPEMLSVLEIERRLGRAPRR